MPIDEVMGLMLGVPGAQGGGSVPSGGGDDVFSGSYDWYYDFDFSLGQEGWTSGFGEYIPNEYFQTVYGGRWELNVGSPTADAASTVRAVSVDIEVTEAIDSWSNGPMFRRGETFVSAEELGYATVVYGRVVKTVEGKVVPIDVGQNVDFFERHNRFSSPYGLVRIRRIKLAGTGTPPWTDGPLYTP